MADGKCVIIGEVLKKYFKERHMTQQAIADVLGVSQGAVTALLNGKPFGSKTAQAWSDNFGFNITWLLTGDGEMLKNSALKSDAREKEINEFVHVPMVPVRAKAGYLIGYGDQEYVDTLLFLLLLTGHFTENIVALKSKGTAWTMDRVMLCVIGMLYCAGR